MTVLSTHLHDGVATTSREDIILLRAPDQLANVHVDHVMAGNFNMATLLLDEVSTNQEFRPTKKLLYGTSVLSMKQMVLTLQ